MPNLVYINGDGIGKEVVPAALQVLKAVVPDLNLIQAEAGWDCFLKNGVSVLPETLDKLRLYGVGLFGAVSSPSYKVPGYRSAIITIRQALDLYSNLRPIDTYPNISTRQGIDMLIVRENTEGMYAGRERMDGDMAIAERLITRKASYRIGKRAAQLALQSNRRLTIVHKANVLPITDGLFRDTVREAIRDVCPPDVVLPVEEMLVDTAALRLAGEPEHFGVLVTTNLFGDILSDLASVHFGGLGMAPSLNWGDHIALAEPVHGSAPDIAGHGIANPIATILSTSMLLRYVWRQLPLAIQIENAVNDALAYDLPVKDGRLAPGLETATITRCVLRRIEHPGPDR
jgi:homoisocitrate dehydrogenase